MQSDEESLYLMASGWFNITGHGGNLWQHSGRRITCTQSTAVELQLRNDRTRLIFVLSHSPTATSNALALCLVDILAVLLNDNEFLDSLRTDNPAARRDKLITRLKNL